MEENYYAKMLSAELRVDFKKFLSNNGLKGEAAEAFLNKVPFPKTAEEVDGFREKLGKTLFDALEEARASGDLTSIRAIGAAYIHMQNNFSLKNSEFMTRNFADLKSKAILEGVSEEDIKKLVDERNKSPGNFVVFEQVMVKLKALMPQKDLDNTQAESIQASAMFFDQAKKIFEAFHQAQEVGSPYRENTVIINNIGFNLFNNDFGINEKEAKLILANIEQLSAKLNNLQGEPNPHHEILQALSVIQRTVIAQHPTLAPSVVSPQVRQTSTTVPTVTGTSTPQTLPTPQNQGILLNDSLATIPTAPPLPPALQGVNGNPSVDTKDQYKKVLEDATKAVHVNAKMETKGNVCTITHDCPETQKKTIVSITGDPTNFKITGNDPVHIANVARLMAKDMNTPLSFVMGKDHEQNLGLLKALTQPKSADKDLIVKVNVTTEQANAMRSAFAKDSTKLAQLDSLLSTQKQLAKAEPEPEVRPGPTR